MESALTSGRLAALDVIVDLLAEADTGGELGSRPFFDRLCEALCRLTSMTRAGLLIYDPGSLIVLPVGSHGVPPEMLDSIYGTLEETPIAQIALAEDRVVQIDSLEGQVPDRYAHIEAVTTLTCTPVSAAGRMLGVIFADRGGERFDISDSERHTMWSLGKTAALAATAHISADRVAQARMLRTRIDLAREIHERVIQRLSGVSLALGAAEGVDPELRERSERELAAAMEDLRSAVVRPPAADDEIFSGLDLRGELERLATLGRHPPIEVGELPQSLPPEIDRLARSVLAEALRNIAKHADASHVAVTTTHADGAFALEVRNDGGRTGGGRGTGLGLRIAAFEALEHRGLLEFGPDGEDWHVRLVVPLQ